MNEQDKQEPVACIGTTGELMWLNKPNAVYSKAVPLYTHPAQPVQPAGAQGEPVGEVIDHERACLFDNQKLKYGTLLYTATPATEINEQLLEALKDLHAWVYRNVEWGCVPREIIKATATIAAAEAAKGGV